MPYAWSNDVEDAYEALSSDEAMEVCYQIARKTLIEEEGWDDDSPDFEDAVAEEADYIGLYRVRVDGALYELLRQWYENAGFTPEEIDWLSSKGLDISQAGQCDLYDYDDDGSLADFPKLAEWWSEGGLSAETLEEGVRGYYEDYYGDYMYFVTGCGYDILSADLLGGKADGRARSKFDSFVREKF